MKIICNVQAYAALYAWDLTYRLDENPFKKCPSTTVLSTLRTYATDYNLRNHTHFSSTVTTIQEQDGRYHWWLPLPDLSPVGASLLRLEQCDKPEKAKRLKIWYSVRM
jgi:hypothetical protein